MSPASSSYREVASASDPDIALPSSDPTCPAELPISADLKAAFLSSLRMHKITLRFLSGPWEAFNLDLVGGRYDIVLTSETIYRNDSLPALLNLMEAACGAAPTLDNETSGLHISVRSPASSSLCLVAAKVLYFGVGGGVSDFINAVEGTDKAERKRGTVETVWERNSGVGRRIMRVKWRRG